ncbi:MAG TPA: DUF1800 domain-containing protein [Casimicrobiaceae bacterium]|nr:DUF1800 domain-containing protein [Casimicrobiaceae bacterium]
MNRTGFGATAEEVQRYAKLTRTQAVDRLLQQARTEPSTPPPATLLVDEPLRLPGADATEDERRAFRRQQARDGLELRGWWMREMLVTDSPLTERMTLVWHNHFVSSQQKVRFARLMYRQNATFREHALGDFRALLKAATREPAMLIYLDAAQNRRGSPNENFARELMELFTLGEGRYSEEDVREVARAFTGWSIDRDTARFRFRPLLHDRDEKTVLSIKGRHDGDAVLDLLLARPETAEHIVGKLWREFVSPDPDTREVGRVANVFRRADYSIKAALRELLTSDAFYAAANRGVLIKSPVELVVGTLRQLDIRVDDGTPFAIAASAMGQNLFSPPNVKGWPGHEAWINASSLLARKQFLERLARVDAIPPVGMTAMMTNDEPMNAAALTAPDDERERGRRFGRAQEQGFRSLRFDERAWMASLPGQDAANRHQHARLLLLPIESDSLPVDGLATLRMVLLDNTFQLK